MIRCGFCGGQYFIIVIGDGDGPTQLDDRTTRTPRKERSIINGEHAVVVVVVVVRTPPSVNATCRPFPREGAYALAGRPKIITTTIEYNNRVISPKWAKQGFFFAPAVPLCFRVFSGWFSFLFPYFVCSRSPSRAEGT